MDSWSHYYFGQCRYLAKRNLKSLAACSQELKWVHGETLEGEARDQNTFSRIDRRLVGIYPQNNHHPLLHCKMASASSAEKLEREAGKL
jgi:hypothetical protein